MYFTHLILCKNKTILSPQNPTYWQLSPWYRLYILDIFNSNIVGKMYHTIINLLDQCLDHSSVLLLLDAQDYLYQKQVCHPNYIIIMTKIIKKTNFRNYKTKILT